MKKITVYKHRKRSRDFPVRSNEGDISRRDWLKGVMGGLCALATSGGISSCACLKRDRPKARLKDFWKRVDEIHARELVDSVISAGKAQVEYSRSLAESERAVIFLGSDAGKEHRWRAEEQFRKRTEELLNAKTALTRFVSKVDKGPRRLFNEFLSARGVASLKADAREFVVKRLSVATSIMPDDAKMAMQKLDKGLDSIGQLRSFEDAVKLFDERLDASIEKKFGNPGIGRGLCILLLILSSMILLMIILAVVIYALICALTLGLLCHQLDLQDVLDDMIDDICGLE